MKLLFTALTNIFLSSTLQHDSKFDLVCQKWKQVGIKSFGKDYNPVDKSMTEIIEFKKDGTYEEELYGNIQFKGKWKFSNDSTKLGFEVTEMNGTAMHDLSLADSKPIDSIIKLTKDTLIYGSLGFYGKNQLYGHDDWYFVREK
jgi:hypothetical protein